MTEEKCQEQQEKRTGKARLRWLDAWKGFAMLLVVAGHIADGYLDAGLFPEYRKTLQLWYDIIYSFHMPLFFVLSGYAFLIAYGGERQAEKKRFRLQLGNLAAVYTLFSILQWIIKMIFASKVNSVYTVRDLFMIPVKTMPPYWYLYVLFFLYLIARVAERGKQPEILKLLFFLGIHFISAYVPEKAWFELKNILYYGVYFYFGIYFAKCAAPVLHEKTKCLCRWWSRLPKSRMLPFLGRYSLEIYVLHCFITAANRTILFKIGIREFYLNVFVNLVMATVLPVLFAVLLKKVHLHDLIFRPAARLAKHTSLK